MNRCIATCLFVFLTFITQIQSRTLSNQVKRRIADGYKPVHYKYPYSSQVYVVATLNDGGTSLCTGTVITETLVLTAAHCFLDTTVNITVGYGSFEKLFLKKVKAKRWVKYPKYDPNGAVKIDIALVIVMKKFPFSDVFKPIWPWTWSLTDEFLKHPVRSLICGYGYEDPDKLSESLLCTSLVTIHQNCFTEDAKQYYWCFDSFPIPGGGYQQPCRGDSGSGIFPEVGEENFSLVAVHAMSAYVPNICGTINSTIGIHITQDIYDWVMEEYEKNVNQNLCSEKVDIE